MDGDVIVSGAELRDLPPNPIAQVEGPLGVSQQNGHRDELLADRGHHVTGVVSHRESGLTLHEHGRRPVQSRQTRSLRLRVR